VGPSKQLKQIIQIEHNIVKNPNWPKANQLAIYKRARPRIWTQGYWETNPGGGQNGTQTQDRWIVSLTCWPLGNAASHTFNQMVKNANDYMKDHIFELWRSKNCLSCVYNCNDHWCLHISLNNSNIYYMIFHTFICKTCIDWSLCKESNWCIFSSQQKNVHMTSMSSKPEPGTGQRMPFLTLVNWP